MEDATPSPESQRLYDIMRLVSDWIWETDSDGRLSYATDRVFEILGRPARSLLGTRLLDLGSFAEAGISLDKPFRDKRFISAHIDGSPRVLLLSGLPLFHPRTGARIGGRGTAKDITPHEEAGAALARGASFQQALLDSIPTPVFIKDRKGRYRGCNRAFEDAVGLPRQQIIGKRMEDILPQNEVEHHVAEEAALYADGRHRTWEVTSPYADGQLHHQVISASVWREDGEVVGMISVIMDITRRKAAEDALRDSVAELTRSNAELQRFAEVAAHDLQEPLRSVVSYCQLMERRLGDRLDAQSQEYLSYAVGGAKRMRALIHDLLVYSRSGREHQPSEDLDARMLIDEALVAVSSIMQETGADIRVEGALPRVHGRHRDLVAVFHQLLDNALKFRRPEVPPLITIEAETPDPDHPALARFTVSDNGIGIDEVHLEQVFAIFRRLHTADCYPGTGVGLAICRRVVEQHGGSIRAERGPEGCRFLFTLPLAAAGFRLPEE